MRRKGLGLTLELGGTIVALSSGAPPSGVAVVRITGPDAHRVAEALGARRLTVRKAHLRALVAPSDGALIDRALCVIFQGPQSATGEDMAELHCHGSPAVIDRILSEALTLDGVRAAEPGEFTLRAVLAGKMGLADAEALADLIDARTEAERRRALRLTEGAFTQKLAQWRADLIAALALCEAHIDFADESDVPDGGPPVDSALTALQTAIKGALDGSRDAHKLNDGFRVAFVGAPNAGKSSLINALAGRHVAIVSPEAGTTRDVVTATLDLGGYKVILADTAGLRDVSEGVGQVEAMGMVLSRQEINEADYIIVVRSPDTQNVNVGNPDLVIGHKSDVGAVPGAQIATAVDDEASIDWLAQHLAAAAKERLSGAETALVTHARQRSGLIDVLGGVELALQTPHLELKAQALRSSCHAIARLTGEIGVEEILDDVFGRFCIGK
ncbi:MAG: tRNA uridine-5-carboxymethylaminomethyl(34) synthesis GTPase MnmE [Pseudomonadota bacterium]